MLREARAERTPSAIAPPRVSLRLTQPASRIPAWVRKSISPIIVLLVWEAVVRTGIISADLFAPPSALPATVVELLVNGTLLPSIGISTARAFAGLAVGTVLAVTSALVAGLWRSGEAAIDPLVQLLRPLPATALTTLVVLLFGIGEPAKVLLIAFGTYFPVYLNTLHGIRSVDMKHVELAAVNGFTRGRLIREVLLPSATPSFFVGFRFSAGISWLLLVVVEQINAKAGLGFLLTEAQRYFRTDVIMTVLIVYALLGLATDAIVVWISRAVLRWRREYEGS